MDLIDFATSRSNPITMLDLVRIIRRDMNNTFLFHSAQFSMGNEENQGVDITLLPDLFKYVFKKVREGWNVHDLCVIPVEKDLLLCVTSSDARVCAEALSFLVEALNDCNIFLKQDNCEDMASNETDENDERMEEDIPPDLVQVNATMKEMNERIEQFIRYKRAQADTNNVLDFCGPPNLSQFCARVDAVLVRKKDSYSHMAVRNVLDRYTSKYITDKLSPEKKKKSLNTSQLHSEAPSQLSQTETINHFQQAFAQPQLGDKRTYKVASLETVVSSSTKQQKTQE